MKFLLALIVALVPSIAAAQQTIVIDAGHGGNDPGGVGSNLQEKAIVLDVSLRFRDLLDADTADAAGGGAWKTRLTRSDDTFVSLAARSAYSNNQGADRFMSIHSNAFGNTTANGTETFSLNAGGTGSQLRNLVQEEMIAAWGLTNRGNKTANFAVLRETAAPAVLHELAFITNATDAAKLRSPDERQKAAIAHLRALQRHFNLAPYLPGEATDELGDVAGFVVNDLGPIEGATVALDTGETTTTSADGAFEFAGIAAGTRTLSASAERHEPGTLEITVALGAVAEPTIELVREDREGETPDDDDPSSTSAGCSASRSAHGLSLLALAFLCILRRRR